MMMKKAYSAKKKCKLTYKWFIVWIKFSKLPLWTSCDPFSKSSFCKFGKNKKQNTSMLQIVINAAYVI